MQEIESIYKRTGDYTINPSATLFMNNGNKIVIELLPEAAPNTVNRYDSGIAGCEFFFPLRECPELKGTYPMFGIVKEGMEELKRIEKVETAPVTNYPIEGVIINEPIEPQII